MGEIFASLSIEDRDGQAWRWWLVVTCDASVIASCRSLRTRHSWPFVDATGHLS